jgi:hypothetical protein
MLIFGIKLIFKGGLISESLSLWLKFPKMVVKSNHFPEQLLFRWVVLRGVIWHPFLGDLSQSKILS